MAGRVAEVRASEARAASCQRRSTTAVGRNWSCYKRSQGPCGMPRRTYSYDAGRTAESDSSGSEGDLGRRTPKPGRSRPNSPSLRRSALRSSSAKYSDSDDTDAFNSDTESEQGLALRRRNSKHSVRWPATAVIEQRTAAVDAHVHVTHSCCMAAGLVALFGVAELSNFDVSNSTWIERPALQAVYFGLLSFSVGCSLYCTLVGIALNLALKSLQLKDAELAERATSEAERLEDVVRKAPEYKRFLKSTGIKERSEYRYPMAYHYMTASTRPANCSCHWPFYRGSQYTFGLLCFPTAFLGLVGAVVLKVFMNLMTDLGTSSSVWPALVVPITAWAVLVLWQGYKYLGCALG